MTTAIIRKQKRTNPTKWCSNCTHLSFSEAIILQKGILLRLSDASLY